MENEEQVLPIETYTDVWQGKKKLYSLWDFQLPSPIPVLTIAVFAITAIVWMPLLFTLGVPFASPFGIVLYLSLPVGLALMADKEIFEKKSLPAYLASQMNFLFQSRQYDDARGVSKDTGDEIVIEPEIWVSMAEFYPQSRKKPRKQRARAKKRT